MLPSQSLPLLAVLPLTRWDDRAKAWLDSNIRIKEDMAPLWGDSIADFEQSLRNGYALAHLARSLGGKKGRIVLVCPRCSHVRGRLI